MKTLKQILKDNYQFNEKELNYEITQTILKAFTEWLTQKRQEWEPRKNTNSHWAVIKELLEELNNENTKTMP